MTPIVIYRQGPHTCARAEPLPPAELQRPRRPGDSTYRGKIVLVVLTAAVLLFLAMRIVDGNERFEWADAGVHDYDGHTIGPCGGDGPFVCITKDGRSVGVVEHFTAPVASYDFLDDAQSPDEQIRLIVGNFVDALRVDRGTSCPALDFLAMEPRTVTVAGRAGLAWGFVLLDEGRVVAQTLDYGVVRDGTVHILVANASDPDGCVPSDHGGFSVAGLREFEHAYEWLASASIFDATV